MNGTAALQLALRSAVAAGVSVWMARELALPHPIYAMIAAVIVTDLSPARTRALALPRIAGTVIGAVVGAAVCTVLTAQTWTMAVGIALSILACHALRMPEAAKLAGFVSGIVLLEHVAAPWSYGWDRLVETLIGIAVAVLVSLVPKLLSSPASSSRQPGGTPSP
jgi:uncharacterized membrane protein YgaE (UPF0421/DUF939 family)